MSIVDFVGVVRGFRGPTIVGNGRNTVSRVLFRRRELTEPHWVMGQTRWVLRRTRWVRVYTQIIGWKELTDFAPRNSVSPEKLTEFGVWNRTPWNRIRPVSEIELFWDGRRCQGTVLKLPLSWMNVWAALNGTKKGETAACRRFS